MSKRSWLYAFISAIFCSAAVALQPTVRAGSISLGGSAKPITPSVTPTSTQSSSSSSANRGAAVSKFSQGTIVPVSTSTNNSNNVSSSLIEELKQRIADLELARTALEGRQDSLESSQSQTDNAIDNVTAQVQSISSNNSDLNDAVSTLQSNNTTLQSTLNSIQQQANSLSDSLNTNIDSRLQYRGLLDSSNNIAFVTKNDITAEKLATKIATNPGAAETLSRSITPTVVSADSVTTALNDSETFKDMVSRAATEKGFAKTTALETNTARIADLESTTGSLQVKVDGDVDTQGSLLYTIKNDDTIRDALKGDPGENGTSVDVDDVVNALKNDAKFIGDTKGQDAKTTWYEYCIKGDNLTAIIQQVYPEVGDCESFTNEQFTELTNGARSKCLSWALTPEELSADEGVGKKLVKIFGSGVLNNLTSYHAGTRIILPNSSVAVNFVIACEKKYDEIMAGDDAKSVEQLYCEAQADNYPNGVTNLDLIKKLFSTVQTCDDFTFEMYTNMTSGAKAYCKSLAQKPEDLDATSGIGLRLEKTFGAGIVDTLKLSKLDTVVNINGAKAAKKFVEACEENYDAIMAGKDAKSVEQLYCEAQADNYPEGTTNLTIIQKLYSTVQTCNDFTPEMYTAITSGAKGYCKSLAQKPEDLDATSGIGLKLERTFGTGIVASLKTNKLDTVVSINGAKAPKNFVEACVENYDEIMAGKDAKSVEQVYCEAQADNYPEGTTNLTIIQKLYSTVRTCDDFTPEMYTAITSGAKGYCKSLAQKPEDLDATSGIGLKLERTFGTGIVASLKTNKLDTVVSINGAKAPKNFVEACEENYDAIMTGKDAKSVEQVYCEAQADNYPAGTTNLAAIITKLYPLVTSCDEFTIEMYTNLTSGATAYCKSLALNPNDLTAGTGIGKRLTQLFGESIIQDLQRDGLDTSIAPKGAKAAKKFVELCVENYDAIMAGKDAKSIEQAYCESRAENYDENTTNLTIIQKFYPSVTNCDMFTAEMYTAITSGAKGYCLSLAKKPEDLNSGTGIGAKLVKIFGNTIIEDLQAHGLETNVFIDGAKGAKTFLEACEENYDAIMTGKDAEPIEMIYCHAQAENYPEGTTNEDLIKKLYPIDDCSEFTYEMYTAITTGAKAYCKSLAQKPASLSADEGIGKKLAETFGSGIISNLKTNKLDARVTIAVKSNSMEKSSTNVEMSFVEACEKKYDEIMSGKSAKSVEQTYCENDDNLTKIITPLFGITDCADFDSSKYQAIVGGAKAYCLSLATEPEKLTEDNTMTKKLKKVFGSDIISKLTTNGAGATVLSTKNGAKAAENVKFVDECAARYDEIMGILPIETEFCESEDRLEKIIKPLYGNDKTCENFTNAEYQAIMGGAKAYCLSLVNDAKNNKLDANIGIGAKLEKILGTGIINQVKTGGAATPVTITKNGAKAATDTNFVLACEEKYNEIVAGDDALGFTYRNKVATYNDLPETCEQGDGYQVEDADQIAEWQGLLYICNCHTVDNVQSCSFPDRGRGVKFQGPKGEDGKSPEQTYCETNFTTVNALYSSIENVNECNEFTAEQYKAMMEGAKTYCLFIAQDFISGNLEINKGIGKKLDKELKLYGTDDGIFALKERKAPITLSEMLQTQKFNNNQSFLDACEEKYNQIMSGEDAETAWHAYCEEQDDNNVSNLTKIIKPLYGDSMTCDTFNEKQYNAIMGGAKAYCMSLALQPEKLSAESGIGKKLEKQLGTGVIDSLKLTGLRTMVTKGTKSGSQEVKFVDACEEKYNEIMSGEDGDSAEKLYCEANSTAVIALFSSGNPAITSVDDCDKFTTTQYQAMTGGAKAYCMLLAQDFAGGKLSETSGIGKKLNEKLKVGSTNNGIFSLSNDSRSLSTVLNTKFNGNSDSFLTACEKNYNEIMAGEDGVNGEDAVTAWCKAHTVATGINGTARLTPAKMARAYHSVTTSGHRQSIKQDTSVTTSVQGYFNSLDACIDAVNNDPELMSGESEADKQFNSEQSGTFTMSSAWSRLSSRRNNFRENFLKGQDGDTFYPSYSDGTLTIRRGSTTGEIVISENIKGQDGDNCVPEIGTDNKLRFLKNGVSGTYCGSSTGYNVKGAKGDKGDVGARGLRGFQGIQGETGKTYMPTGFDANGNMIFAEGSSGTTGPISLNMKTGIKNALTGSVNGTDYAAGATLEDAIKLIAAQVATDVSKQVSQQVATNVSKHVADKVSTKVAKDTALDVADKVAQDRVNSIKGEFVSSDKMGQVFTFDNSTNAGSIMKFNPAVSFTGSGTSFCRPGATCSTNTQTVGDSEKTIQVTTFTGSLSDINLGKTEDFTFTNKNDIALGTLTTEGANYDKFSNVSFKDGNTNKVADSIAFAGLSDTVSIIPSGITTQTTCSANQYKKNGVCLDCPVGSTSDGGTVTQCNCSGNKDWSSNGYCVETKTSCETDSTKYWNGSECKTIPANAERYGSGFRCLANYYKDNDDVCQSCGEGTSAAGATTCTCSSGTWDQENGTCSSQSTSSNPTCGTNQELDSSDQCVCKAGFYKNGSSCTVCPAGTYKNMASNATSCTECNFGQQYQDQTGQTSCKTCQDGYTVSSNRQQCSAPVPTCGSNQELNGSNQCVCKAGYYLNNGNCTACAAGTYKDSAGNATSCSTCASGKYQPDTAQTSCKTCNGTVSSDHTQCTTAPSCNTYISGVCVDTESGCDEAREKGANVTWNGKQCVEEQSCDNGVIIDGTCINTESACKEAMNNGLNVMWDSKQCVEKTICEKEGQVYYAEKGTCITCADYGATLKNGACVCADPSFTFDIETGCSGGVSWDGGK